MKIKELLITLPGGRLQVYNTHIVKGRKISVSDLDIGDKQCQVYDLYTMTLVILQWLQKNLYAFFPILSQ